MDGDVAIGGAGAEVFSESTVVCNAIRIIPSPQPGSFTLSDGFVSSVVALAIHVSSATGQRLHLAGGIVRAHSGASASRFFNVKVEEN